VAKASKRERNRGLEGMPEQNTWTDSRKANSNDIMTMKRVNPRTGELEERKDVTRSANHHPTVKPIKLMEYLIKLVTPPGGTVLDPFCGSGSTGVAAFKNGFRFIGIEMSREYAEIAERRIAHAKGEPA
jgi:site-specific DNA-methyltransferase (adenine-specific)